MSKPIIEIEGLGKSYRIGANREKYLSLRDEMAKQAHGFYRRFLSRHRHVPKDEEFWALQDVSFSVNAGEAVGIIGRNGAGKSTLLKILSKITPPTTGKITLRGRVASLLEVGTGFHPELSGRENTYLNGAILGMTRAEIKRKFDEIVAFAEVEKFLDTPVKRYSSGMYVRLAFAVAAHLEPEILIVDEVLAVGDSEFQKKCLGKMSEVARAGRTVLFVSHNLPAVQRLCNSGIVLQAGRVFTRQGVDGCIASYLQAGQQATRFAADLSMVPQPEADCFKILSIAITDAKRETVDHLSVGQECHVELRFQCVRSHRDLIVGFAVRTADEFPLFATHNNDYGQTFSLDPGIYSVRMHFYPNFLRQGRYTLSVGAISSGRMVSHITSALMLNVEPVASDRNRNVDDRIGALFIPMNWQKPERIGL